MKWSTCVISCLVVSTAIASEASAAFPEAAVVRVVLGQKSIFGAHGSGVVVRQNPPIVATCAHVIAGEEKVFVYLAPYGKFIGVKAVAADSARDLAFLLLDQDEIESLPVAAVWEPGFLPLIMGQRFTLHGFRDPRLLKSAEGRFLGPSLSLSQMASASPTLFGGSAGMPVFSIDDPNSNGLIVYSGDSGGPIVVNDRVVALASGVVLPTSRIGQRKPFAVPASLPIPGIDEFTTQPKDVQSPFPEDGIEIEGAVFKGMRSRSVVASNVSACADKLDPVFREYDIRQEQLPLEMPNEPPDTECALLYRALASHERKEEGYRRASRESRLLVADLAGGKEPDALLERKAQEMLSKMVGRDEKRRELFKSVLAENEKQTPSQQRSQNEVRAAELQQDAEIYDALADRESDAFETIIRTGVYTTPAAPPAAPPVTPPQAPPKP